MPTACTRLPRSIILRGPKASTSEPIAKAAGKMGKTGEIPDVKSLRIPVRYLANLLTAGDEAPVVRALERLLAMRAWRRAMNVDVVQGGVVVDPSTAKGPIRIRRRR